MRKGFTLIELLAVIVVLTIILLIAMPIVLNVISDARKGAFEASAMGLVKAAENECITEMLSGPVTPRAIEFDEWNVVGTEKLEFTGRVPKKGKIFVDNKCEIAMFIHDDNWCVTRESDGNIFTSPYEGECKLENAIFFSCDNGGYPCLPLLQNYNVGEFTSGIPIASAEDLNAVRSTELYTFAMGTIHEITTEGGLDKDYIQIADIDLSSYSNWDPLGDWVEEFTGSYNGNNYTINNMVQDLTTKGWGVGGLFGVVENAIVENIHLRNVDVYSPVGSPASLSSYVMNSNIRNCSVIGGTVEGLADSVGGLIGWFDVTGDELNYIENCYASLNVIGVDDVGGLVSWVWAAANTNVLVRNSYSNSTVTGNYRVGGLIGAVAAKTNARLVIENSYSISDVSLINLGDYSRAGGLIGSSEGTTDGDIEINLCYSVGTVVGGTDTGGLIGWNEYTDITHSYYDSEISGFIDTDRGDPKNTAEMQDIDTFLPEWNIIHSSLWDNQIWAID